MFNCGCCGRTTKPKEPLTLVPAESVPITYEKGSGSATVREEKLCPRCATTYKEEVAKVAPDLSPFSSHIPLLGITRGLITPVQAEESGFMPDDSNTVDADDSYEDDAADLESGEDTLLEDFDPDDLDEARETADEVEYDDDIEDFEDEADDPNTPD
jgi:hypothetical protein